MCFGMQTQKQQQQWGSQNQGYNSEQQQEQNQQFSNQNLQHQSGGTQYTANPYVSGGAIDALTAAKNLLSGGFTPYGGQMVAGPSGQQQSSWGAVDQLAAGGAPNVNQAAGAINNAGSVGPGSVSANPIWSQMSPYMSQYVQMSLAPQLAQQDIQFAGQNRNLNAGATRSGAFGDSRAGVEAGNLSLNQDLARQGLIGSAYNQAFNTAIGAGAQDVSNQLGAQTTTANLANEYARNQLATGQAWQGLGGYQVGTGLQLANAQNQFGQQQTAQDQAKLNAALNMWQMGQQYPFQALQALNQTVGQSAAAMPAASQQYGTTSQGGYGSSATGTHGTGSGSSQGNFTGFGKTQAPDNSGWGMLGSLFGSGAGGGMGNALFSALPAMLSEPDFKYDVARVGELHDGQNVYRFRYKGDPTRKVHVGLMADEVEKVTPDAVVIPFKGGPRFVDYDRATMFSRMMGEAA